MVFFDIKKKWFKDYRIRIWGDLNVYLCFVELDIFYCLYLIKDYLIYNIVCFFLCIF